MSLLTDEEVAALNEIDRLMAEAYRHYFANTDGHCKSSEGHISVGFGNFFDRSDGIRVRPVEVYSYVLGPHRSHFFDSPQEALEAVREWHADEMSHDYSEDE